MDRSGLLELLAAGRPDLHKLLRALELLVIRLHHGLGGQIFRLGLGELRAKERHERRPTLDRRPQLHRHLGDDAPDDGEDLHLPVGISHDGPRHLDRHVGFDDGHLGCFDPGLRHGLGREDDLHVASRLCGSVSRLVIDGHRLRLPHRDAAPTARPMATTAL